MGKLNILPVSKGDFKQIMKFLFDLKVFPKDELEVAKEVLRDSLILKEKSEYKVLVAKINGDLAGFICYGLASLSKHTYDLYWIAVSKKYQRQNIGTMLIERCEKEIKKSGAKIFLVETSSTKKYEKARNFYEKMGFKKLVEIKNYYKNRDDKIIYIKYFNGGK